MMDLIRKRDIDYISAPIAPVLKGEKVHYEYVAFRKQIEDITPVPAISISVIEGIKKEIIESSHGKWYVGRLDGKTDEVLLMDEVIEIIDTALKEDKTE